MIENPEPAQPRQEQSMRPRSKKDCTRLCSGCRHDRYNHPGLCERPGIDAPVTSAFCWHLEPGRAVWLKHEKRWAMSCHSSSHSMRR